MFFCKTFDVFSNVTHAKMFNLHLFDEILLRRFFVPKGSSLIHGEANAGIKCRCIFCNIDVHRAPFVKHLKSNEYLENGKNICTNSLFETKTNKITKQKIYNPKSLKEEARE